MKPIIALWLACTLILALLFISTVQAQDAGIDQGPPPASAQSLPEPQQFSAGVSSAFDTFIITLLSALTACIGLGLWWFRSWLADQRAERQNNLALQQQKVAAQNAMIEMNVAQTRSLAKMAAPADAADLEAKAAGAERSKIIVLPPGGLP